LAARLEGEAATIIAQVPFVSSNELEILVTEVLQS